MQGKSTTGGSSECPECHGTGQVTQMGGRMKFNIQCPRCGGTGKVQSGCATCDGEGVVTRREPLEFRIKPGTRDGQRIRLAGKGNAGTDGGAAGDLYLIVKVGTHSVFTRVADDIYVTVPVTMTEAALGAKIEVPTIDTHEGGGRTQLKIPPGTQTGQKLRLRDKGVPSASQEGKRGDEIVEVKIVVPKVQDERSKEIIAGACKAEPGGSTGGAVGRGVGHYGDEAETKGAYMISAVAEMYEIHPQTLRLYEREGLLLPSRSEGNTRLYTDEDLERLEFILNLARDLGVNIAGIAIVLQMRERMEEMNRQMQGFVDYVRTEMLARMQQQQQPGLGLVPMTRTAIVPQRAAAAKVVAIPGKALSGKAAAVSEKTAVLKGATTTGKSAGKLAKGK